MSNTEWPNNAKPAPGPVGDASDRLRSSVDPACERRLVKRVVAIALFVVAVLIGFGTISLQCAKLDKERRSQATRLGFEAHLAEAKRKGEAFRFDDAMAELMQAERDLEQSRYSNENLWDGLWKARSGVADAHRDHKTKLTQGYRVIRGKLLPPSEQERIAERERRRAAAAEQRRQAEAERRRHERAVAEDRRQAEAERQRRKQAEQSRLSVLAAREAAFRGSWVQYMDVCGIKAQEVNRARSKKVFRESHEGQTVAWEGRVHRVDERIFAEGFAVEVKMDPTESMGSDVTLLLAKPFEDLVIGLNSGDLVEFAAVIQEQGGSVFNHRLDVLAIKKK